MTPLVRLACALTSLALVACGDPDVTIDGSADAAIDAHVAHDAGPDPRDAAVDTGPSCDPDAGLVLCGAECVDPLADDAHCGACDAPCATDEACREGVCEVVCRIDGAVHAAGALDPGDPCRRCDPATSSSAWTPLDDGSDCGDGLLCGAGVCASQCVIDGAVHAPGTTSPAAPCESCDPAVDARAWTLLADGAPCGDGRVCLAAVCEEACYVDGAARADGELDPANDCRACIPATSTDAWSVRADGSVCGAAQYCTAGACGPTWHGTTPAGLTPIYGGSAAAGLDGRIYVFGSVTSGSPGAMMQIYDPATDTFTRGPDVPYAPYRSCAVTAPSGRIYVIGGSPSGAAVTTVVVYDPVTNTYGPGPSMPFAAHETGCARGHDGRIYVFASDDASTPGALYVTARTLILDPATNVWSIGAAMPSPRQRMTAVTLPDGRIAVSGGNRGYLFAEISALNEIYTPATNTWTTAAPQPVGLHWHVGALRADGRMILTGGVGVTGMVDTNTYVFDPATNSWALGTPTTAGHYAAYAARTPDGRVYVLTGRLLGPAMSNVVDALY